MGEKVISLANKLRQKEAKNLTMQENLIKQRNN